ncbi:lipopolysaccharide biosynthesis protein [Alicyclobacillus sp. SP_1]|uniref:lipopolysaccharide biosynthesis protein n=1 Tax=Alicyclobacillus sp. SP_1 TaxID=2942475 RepID=UPI0021589EAD|nr:polysaccharide biosynthesis C-terminal domain-containing protein [Alicyclobacillus sp. SP_1]
MNDRKTTFFSFIYRGLSSVLGFLNAIVVRRFLTVEDVGQLQYSQVLLNGGQNFLAGYTNWYGYAIPKRPTETTRIAQMGNLVVFGACLLLWAIALPVTLVLVHRAGLPAAWAWTMLSLPLALLFNYGTRVLNALHDIRWLNRANIAQPLSFLVFYLSLFLIHSPKLEQRLTISYILWTSSWILAVLIALVAAYRRLNTRARKGENVLRWRFSAVDWRGTFAYGSWSSVSNVVHYLNYRVDYFYVAAVLGPRTMSIYGTAVAVAEVLNTLSQSIVSVVFARMTGANREDAIAVTTMASRQTIITSTLAATGMAIVFPFLFPLFGHHDVYLEAVVPFLILLPGLIFKAASNILLQYATNSLGQPKTAIWMNGLAVLLNLAVCVVLVQHFGMRGAAAASTIAYILGFAIYCVWFGRVSKSPARALWLLRRSDFVPYFDIMRRILHRRRP